MFCDTKEPQPGPRPELQAGPVLEVEPKQELKVEPKLETGPELQPELIRSCSFYGSGLFSIVQVWFRNY